jgi:hypothetical protein
MGSQTGSELGQGQSIRQVAGNRAYEVLPLEEGRALIQDWDELGSEEKVRLIFTGISKTAGLVGGTTAMARNGLAVARPTPTAPVPGVAATAIPRPKAAPPTARPTWQASEVNEALELGDFGFTTQQSYLNGARVRRGTKDSVRPDLVSENLKLAVDVKNYNLTTARGRYAVQQDILAQVNYRTAHLPGGFRQGVILDVRGQAVNDRLLQNLTNRLVRKSGGVLREENIWRDPHFRTSVNVEFR